jgi:hypothetical protein
VATHAAGPDRTEGRLAVRGRERHAVIHDLLAQGRNYTQISQMLGLTRHTVRQFARAATPGHLTEDETAKLAKIKARSPQLNATVGHVTAFAEMTGRHH